MFIIPYNIIGWYRIVAVRFGQFFQRLYYRIAGSHCLEGCLEPDGPVSVPGRNEHVSDFVTGNVIIIYNTYFKSIKDLNKLINKLQSPRSAMFQLPISIKMCVEFK